MTPTYKIRCSHCCNTFNARDHGNKLTQVPDSNMHIETETSMRCPICRRRINNSVQEFRQQIETIYTNN